MISNIDKFFVPIVIQRSTMTTDSWGNPIQTWSNYSTILGLLRQINGSKLDSSRKDTTTTTHRLYCRLNDIKPTDRVLYNNQTYSITRVNNVMGFDELLQVDCEYDQN